MGRQYLPLLLVGCLVGCATTGYEGTILVQVSEPTVVINDTVLIPPLEATDATASATMAASSSANSRISSTLSVMRSGLDVKNLKQRLKGTFAAVSAVGVRDTIKDSDLKSGIVDTRIDITSIGFERSKDKSFLDIRRINSAQGQQYFAQLDTEQFLFVVRGSVRLTFTESPSQIIRHAVGQDGKGDFEVKSVLFSKTNPIVKSDGLDVAVLAEQKAQELLTTGDIAEAILGRCDTLADQLIRGTRVQVSR